MATSIEKKLFSRASRDWKITTVKAKTGKNQKTKRKPRVTEATEDISNKMRKYCPLPLQLSVSDLLLMSVLPRRLTLLHERKHKQDEPSPCGNRSTKDCYAQPKR
jgi:hypothetical protein